MLKLHRFERQRIRIKAPGCAAIWVTVLEAASGAARIGVDAPPEVEVDREEIHRRVLAEGRKKSRPA